MEMIDHDLAKFEEVEPKRCKAFVEALSNAGQSSIDAFLNANRHQLGFQTIGRGAIAQVLLDYERKETSISDDDWMSYLFEVMVEGVASGAEFLEQNRIGFITFNYDRLLETFLFQRIKHSFGLDQTSSRKILSEIPIHHVYGTLGSFPIPKNLDASAWIEASKGIRTIFDSEHDQATLEDAKSLLSNAHHICLLGFGFHPENINILNLVEYARACHGAVVSSRYKMTESEWNRLTRPFAEVRIEISHPIHRCLEALRSFPIF